MERLLGYVHPFFFLLLFLAMVWIEHPPQNVAEWLGFAALVVSFSSISATVIYQTWRSRRDRELHERRVGEIWAVHGPHFERQGVKRSWLRNMGYEFVLEKHSEWLLKPG